MRHKISGPFNIGLQCWFKKNIFGLVQSLKAVLVQKKIVNESGMNLPVGIVYFPMSKQEEWIKI